MDEKTGIGQLELNCSIGRTNRQTRAQEPRGTAFDPQSAVAFATFGVKRNSSPISMDI